MKRITIPYGYWEAIMWTGCYICMPPGILMLWYSMVAENDCPRLFGWCGVLLVILGLIAYLVGGKMTGWEHFHGKGTLP